MNPEINYDLICPGCGSPEISEILCLTDEPGSPYDGFQHFLKCQGCKQEFEEKEAELLEIEPEELETQRLEAFAWSCKNEF